MGRGKQKPRAAHRQFKAGTIEREAQKASAAQEASAQREQHQAESRGSGSSTPLSTAERLERLAKKKQEIADLKKAFELLPPSELVEHGWFGPEEHIICGYLEVSKALRNKTWTTVRNIFLEHRDVFRNVHSVDRLIKAIARARKVSVLDLMVLPLPKSAGTDSDDEDDSGAFADMLQAMFDV